jgi:hypothetical protein
VVGEDSREMVAEMIAAAMSDAVDVAKVFTESANCGNPRVRLILSDSTIINVTITKAKTLR